MAATVTPQDIEATIIENLVTFGADPDDVTRDATLEVVGMRHDRECSRPVVGKGNQFGYDVGHEASIRTRRGR